MTDEVPPLPPRLFTVEEFDRLLKAQVFAKDERAELLGGQIFSRPAAGPRETACIKHLDHVLGDHTAQRVLTSVHDPIVMPDALVRPDLLLLKLRADNYFGGRPSAAEVLLAVEVTDHSADFERDLKIPLYGRQGIPEAWLIDLSGDVIEVYRRPEPSGYAEKLVCRPGDSLAPVALPDIACAVADILGPPA